MEDGTLCPLLSIPPELGLMIYEYLWYSVTAGITSHIIEQNHVVPSSSNLNLLLTCRQINYEARKIAFHRHTFTISNTSVGKMMPCMGPAQLYTLITSILIYTYYQGPPFPDTTPIFCPTNMYFGSTVVEDSVRRLPSLKEIVLIGPAGQDVDKLGEHPRMYMRRAHVRPRRETLSKRAIRCGSGDEVQRKLANSGPHASKYYWYFLMGDDKKGLDSSRSGFLSYRLKPHDRFSLDECQTFFLVVQNSHMKAQQAVHLATKDQQVRNHDGLLYKLSNLPYLKRGQ